LCPSHNPDYAETLRQQSARGGAKSSKLRALRARRAGLDSLPALAEFTSGVIHDALDGTVAPEVARVVLYGISIQRQLVEAADVDARLAAIEERLGATTQDRRAAWPAA
jgi:hypothetical protein